MSGFCSAHKHYEAGCAQCEMPAHYWDLAQVFELVGSYTDFEGLSNSRHTEQILNDLYVQQDIELYANPWPNGTPDLEKEMVIQKRKLMTDIVAHWVYENEDQGGLLVDRQMTCDFIHALGFLLQSRWWLKREGR